MSDAQSLIPEITGADIEWVRTLMGLDVLDEPRRAFLSTRQTLDVSACPGSGKTTLVVAKLAILARKWPHHSKGICVLSHTNVAREEIQRRLSSTVVGQRLLGYPHFIDTIHGFVNRFLALPWLNSNGYPAPTVDNDVTAGYRRGVIGKKYWTVQKALDSKHTGFDRLRLSARDLSFDLGGKPFPFGPHTDSFVLAKQAIEAASKAGYFCYDEMFVWAHALLEDCPDVATWLKRRFPLILLDEMQDTQELQGRLLHAVFPRKSPDIVVQRVGDPNQAIFDSTEAEADKSEPFPDPDAARNLSIPNSYRFGQTIATLATPLAIQKVGTNGLVGIGPKSINGVPSECAHAIFVFPDRNAAGVLDAFGVHVLSTFADDALASGSITAVGAVHRDEPPVLPGDVKYPKAVPNYWGGYTAELARKDPHPKTLVQYFRLAQAAAKANQDLAPGVEKLASGVVRLAGLIGDISQFKRKDRAHRTIVDALVSHNDAVGIYLRLVRTILVNRMQVTHMAWDGIRADVLATASFLCLGDIDQTKATSFLAWQGDGEAASASVHSIPLEAGPNVYRASSGGRHVDIKLGSIHSVKGQTHLATLVLHTYWHKPSSQRILPWLLGDKSNLNGAGPQDSKRLLQTFVAMTRPSHMICLAIPRSTLGDEANQVQHITRLAERGWQVVELS